MKTYLIRGHKTAVKSMGKCLTCGNDIEKGQKYQYADPGRVIYPFHETCEVNQALIGKNTIPEKPQKSDAEIQKQVEEMTQTTVAQIEQKTIEPVKEPAKKTQSKKAAAKKQPAEDNNAVYCTKCHAIHNVGTRRHRQHKMYLQEKPS